MPMHLCALCGEAAAHQEDGALLNLPVYTESLNHEGGGEMQLLYSSIKNILQMHLKRNYT